MLFCTDTSRTIMSSIVSYIFVVLTFVTEPFKYSFKSPVTVPRTLYAENWGSGGRHSLNASENPTIECCSRNKLG